MSQTTKVPGYISDEEVIPDHFYDSDLASINEKDFLSDNQPPKDIIQERKLLKKQKLLHIFKTIVRLGHLIDKPAPYDLVTLQCKEVPQDQVKPRPLNLKAKEKKMKAQQQEEKEEDHICEEVSRQREKVEQELKQGENSEGRKEQTEQNTIQKEQQILAQIQAYEESHPQDYPFYFASAYLQDSPNLVYNLGKEHQDIQFMVTSMKRGEAAVFELQHLEVSPKSNIKRRVRVDVYVLWLHDWTTVIDLDCNGKFMKEVITRGEGHQRVAKHDEVSFRFKLSKHNHTVKELQYDEPVQLEEEFLEQQPNILWKILHSMKAKENVKVNLTDQTMKELEADKYSLLEQKEGGNTQGKIWLAEVEVFWFHSIDNVFLDGRLLKKTILKGVSTARPDPSSCIYFALQFLGPNGQIVFTDDCFNSDWWQDLSKLQQIHCRKAFLDDESLSEMMVKGIQRTKPAQIATFQCRDPSLFTWGTDYQEYLKHTKLSEPSFPVKITVRLYNFSEGKNCFNMDLHEKIVESKRKKQIAIKYLNRGDIDQALKEFQTIVSFFQSGQIDQEAYNEKVSALMNSSLCHLKKEQYKQLINITNIVLQKPKHGYDPEKLKINGPGHAKIEGKLPDEPDERETIDLAQNPKILDKCRYRKALALIKIGEGEQALQCLQDISDKSEDVVTLIKEAEKSKLNYQKKSVKMYKNMFG